MSFLGGQTVFEQQKKKRLGSRLLNISQLGGLGAKSDFLGGGQHFVTERLRDNPQRYFWQLPIIIKCVTKSSPRPLEGEKYSHLLLGDLYKDKLSNAKK